MSKFIVVSSAFRASVILIVVAALTWAMEGVASAAHPVAHSEYSGGHSGHQAMMVDVLGGYVRDTRADGPTDTATRLSLGGMFSSWIGLDLQGTYEVKSKSYLVGTDLRFVPIDWLFLKGGIGAYADKVSRQFKSTPLAGGGLKAQLSDDYYLLSEVSYFQVNDRNNVSFGLGIGMMF